MNKFALISLLTVLLLPNSIKVSITLIVSIIWIIYAFYYSYKLYNLKDQTIITNKYREDPPNNNYSPYVRYLYSGKIDYKVFLLIVLELLIKGSISLKIENNVYYIVDNKVIGENLKKSEIYVKKILFKDIGEGNYVILNKMIRICNTNSGYLYSVYKELENVFEYEVAFNKYFKSNKKLVDDSTMFLMISFVLSLYNIFFTKKILLALFIFGFASLLCKYINDLKNREEEASMEYERWLEFKNYINKDDNNLDELDAISLEQYLLYAYSIDSYFEFKKVIEKKNISSSKSEILNLVNNGIFDNIDYIFSKSISKLNINAVLLFAKNRGRR